MRDNTIKRRLLAMSVSLALLGPCATNAAGLGRLAILSALGQPLNAEIELISVQKGESVVAKLASPDTYQQANLPLNVALLGMRLTVEKRPNGQQFLKATTSKPITEPFVELVVELSSEHGRVTRQYTILLDPPGYGRAAAEVPPPLAASPAPRAPVTSVAPPVAPVAAAPAAPVAAAPAGAPSEEIAGTESTPPQEPPPVSALPPSDPAAAPSAASPMPSRAITQPVRRAASASDTAAAAAANQYGPIEPGETLTQIARSVKPEGVTLEQALVSLYRNNPDAFIKKNMNLVKSGKILSIPDAAEFASVPQREAAREVHVQIADFNAFRARLADGAAAARDAGSVTSGRISARVADSAGAEPRDTVRLSKGEPPSGRKAGTGSAADRVRALEEEAVAREKALSEANERIAQLEKTIKDMQRLAELKGSTGAPAQQGAAKATSNPQPAASGKAPISAAAVIAQSPLAEAEPKRNATDPGKSAASDGAKSQAKDVSNAAAPPQAKDGTVPQVVKAKPAPMPAAPAEDFVESLVNEPLYLAAGGAAVLLGGFGLAMALRRRRAGKEDARDDELFSKKPKTAPMPSAAATSAAPAALAAASGVAAARANQQHDDDADDERTISRIADERTVAPLRGSDEHDLRVARGSSDVATEAEDTQTVAVSPEFSGEAQTAGEPDFFAMNGAKADEKPPEHIVRDFGLDLPEGASAADAPAAAPEVSSMDFNLDPLPAMDSSGETVLADRVTAAAAAPLEDFKLDDLDLSFGSQPASGAAVKDDHWYDVQQKFDLAKAYEEMGDKDGARDILQEVVKEGDAEQQTQARKLLETLS